MAERLGDAEKRYYGRVVDLLNDRDEGEETGETFAQNVLRQIQVDGVSRVFCDKDGSRAVERLLQGRNCDAEFLQSLLESVSTDFRRVAADRCGSHSTEALLKAVGRLVNTSTADTEDNLETLFLQVFSDASSSLSDLLAHPYASHVVCTAVQVLSGVYVAERLTRSRYSREFRKAKLEEERPVPTGAVVERRVAVPHTFTAELNKLGRCVCKLENFPSLLVDVQASPVLQVLLRVLTERLPKRGRKMIRRVVESIKDALKQTESEELSEVFTCSVGSHLVGVLLELATADLHQWIWETCFEGKVLSFSLHPIANFPLQQFMSVCDPAQASLVMAELLPHLEDVLFAGHSGVVVKMAEAGLRTPDQQSEILKTLLTVFHAETNTSVCVPLFLTLTAYEVYAEHVQSRESDSDLERKSVHVQGSLLVQALVKYDNPRVIVRSLLGMETEDIMWLSRDMSGSHVIDAFLTSPTVKSAKKKKLVDKLMPQLVSLCKDKHGSRVMDAIWRNSEVTAKEKLAEQLITHETELGNDFYGRIVLRNCNVAHYRRKQTVWQEKMATASKTREMFHDLFEGVQSDDVSKGSQKRGKHDRTKSEETLSDSLKKKRKKS